MKFYCALLILTLASACVNGQTFSPETVAKAIAKKMQDSLSINEGQKNEIYNANMLLHSRKMTIRQQTTDPDALRTFLQKAENSRDSLYQTILTPPQFHLYGVKKPSLISGN